MNDININNGIIFDLIFQGVIFFDGEKPIISTHYLTASDASNSKLFQTFIEINIQNIQEILDNKSLTKSENKHPRFKYINVDIPSGLTWGISHYEIKEFLSLWKKEKILYTVDPSFYPNIHCLCNAFMMDENIPFVKELQRRFEEI